MTFKEIDIAKSIKTIEWLKSEILKNVSSLFAVLINGVNSTRDTIISLTSNIIIFSYVLSKRLGIEFDEINENIRSKLKKGINEKHEIEDNYKDFSNLLRVFDKNIIK